jgi:hypothetical protein
MNKAAIEFVNEVLLARRSAEGASRSNARQLDPDTVRAIHSIGRARTMLQSHHVIGSAGSAEQMMAHLDAAEKELRAMRATTTRVRDAQWRSVNKSLRLAEATARHVDMVPLPEAQPRSRLTLKPASGRIVVAPRRARITKLDGLKVTGVVLDEAFRTEA